MNKLMLGGLAAMLTTTLTATGALADPVTRTYTIDTPKYEGEKTVTRDKEAGTLSKDSELTRKSDGAVATREYDRARTAHGYDATGSLTRFSGQSYEYSAKLRRGEHRVARSQVLRNDQGQVVAAKRTVRPRRSR